MNQKLVKVKEEFAEYLKDPNFCGRYNELQDKVLDEIDEVKELNFGITTLRDVYNPLLSLKALFIFVTMTAKKKTPEEIAAEMEMGMESLDVLYEMVAEGWVEFKRRYTEAKVH